MYKKKVMVQCENLFNLDGLLSTKTICQLAILIILMKFNFKVVVSYTFKNKNSINILVSLFKTYPI